MTHRSGVNVSGDSGYRKVSHEGLLTVDEAASYICMSASWLYESKIPYVRLGRSRRYKRFDLDEYINRNHSTNRRAAE